jgi:CBS domain-containing protein
LKGLRNMDGGLLVEVGVARCSIRDESIISRAITLFPSDTVLAALQVMHRYGLAVLPVVDEERGELLGEVTEAELCRVASRLPLIPIAEVLTAKASSGGEGMTGGFGSMEEDFSGEASRSHWLH